jgi:hypothetical protein
MMLEVPSELLVVALVAHDQTEPDQRAVVAVLPFLLFPQ